MVELAKRGQCAFDDAALIHGLAATPVDEGTWCEMDPGLFEQYNTFYSLDFEKIGATRSYGLAAVGQERVFMQTFSPPEISPMRGHWCVTATTIIWACMGIWSPSYCSVISRWSGLIKSGMACLPDRRRRSAISVLHSGR